MAPRDFKTESDLIETLNDRYGRTMLAIAVNIMGDLHEAEDVVQESLIRIMRNIDKINDIEADECKHYLLVITKNTALTAYKKRKNRRSVTKDPSELVNVIEGKVDTGLFDEKYGFGAEIQELIGTLSETDRDILLFRYCEDRSDREIAAILGISQTAVRKRISRAHKRLKEIVEKRGLYRE